MWSKVILSWYWGSSTALDDQQPSRLPWKIAPAADATSSSAPPWSATVLGADFPWFGKATLEQVTTVEWPTPDHLYWPLLDVDLAVESIRNPSLFPLVATAPAEGGRKQ